MNKLIIVFVIYKINLQNILHKLVMQLFKCFLRSGHSKIRYFVSFDQNHIQNLLKAQENINTSQNIDQWINYQIQLSNAYSIFPQENEKICSQSIFHKLLAVKQALDHGVQIEKQIIDQISQDNIHRKLIYQNYQNQEHPSGYGQNFNDILLQELLRMKFVLKKSKIIDRYITNEEFQEWKESIIRSIQYKVTKNPNIDDEIQGLFQLIEYYTGIILQAEQTGSYYESMDELLKTLDMVDKLKILIKQDDPNYLILLRYEARVCAHFSHKLKQTNINLCLKLLDRALKTYEKLNLQHDIEYVNMYRFYCQYYPFQYDLIDKTLKLHQHFDALENKYKNIGYQFTSIVLFHQQVMVNKTKFINEIKIIIEKDRNILNYDDFRLLYLINRYIDGFGLSQDELKKNIQQFKATTMEFLKVLALFLSHNELKIMAEQVNKANPDSKELNSMIILLNCLFTETNQFYPFIAKDKQIWDYVISLFKLCLEDENQQKIIDITLYIIKYCASDVHKYDYIINVVYIQQKLLKFLGLNHSFNEIKNYIITQGPQHQMKDKFIDLSIE
ncbi:hypothetical protein pb186bvf_011780 [Paramecium bursaria]